MKTLSEMITEIRNVDVDSFNSTPRFERLLSQIISFKSSETIIPLLGLFRDNAKRDELMFSIIHGMENFDDRTYVSQILCGTPALCVQSPRWASIIFMRILNSQKTRMELVRQLPTAEPEIKMAVKALMKQIKARDETFLLKTAVALVAAS
jgi:hypothetical protein